MGSGFIRPTEGNFRQWELVGHVLVLYGGHLSAAIFAIWNGGVGGRRGRGGGNYPELFATNAWPTPSVGPHLPIFQTSG